MITDRVRKRVRVSKRVDDEGGGKLTRDEVIYVVPRTKGELTDENQPGKKPRGK